MIGELLRSRHAPALALGAAVLLEIVYVLLYSPFVTVDAATHIGSAAALGDSLGDFELGERFLEWNYWPAPSLVATLLLALFMPVVGIEAAEALVLVGYVVALPVSALYALRARPGSDWLVFLVLPLTFSLVFLWGFLSFAYSVVVFLMVAGFVLRTDLRMPAIRTAALAALLVLAFFSHFVGYLAAGLLLLLVFAVRAALAPSLRRTIVVRGTVALLPSALLALIFVVSSNSASAASWESNPVRRFAGMVTLKSGIVSYDRLELIFCLLAAGALWALIVVALVRRPLWRERDPDTIALASFTLAVGLVAVLAPEAVASGGSLLSRRLVLFPVLGALLWLSRQNLGRAQLLAAATAAAVAAFGLAAVRDDELRRVERAADDLATITNCVERGSTIVQGNLAYVAFGSAAVLDPHTGEAGRVAAARDGLDLGSIDMHVPFWLQRFRSDTSPYAHLVLPEAIVEDSFIDDVPPPLDFASFERETGVTVDYVLLWGRPEMTEETRSSAAWQRFDRELRSEYRLTRRSPLGWWEIWGHGRRGCAETAS